MNLLKQTYVKKKINVYRKIYESYVCAEHKNATSYVLMQKETYELQRKKKKNFGEREKKIVSFH